MNSRNLIPKPRLQLKRRQAAIRRWVLIDVTYAIALLLAGVAYYGVHQTGAGPATAASLSAETQQSLATLATLHQKSSVLTANLRSIAEVSSGPDWSTLLAVLAKTLGDDVVLSSVDCMPSHVATGAHAVGAGPQAFRVAGIGRTQSAVARFVLAIESLGLFEHVDLVQTTPRPLRGTDCVGFELQCSLHSLRGSLP